MRELIIFMCMLCIVVPLGLHMTPNTAAADGLEVYLPLDGNLLDASGNGHNGVLTNGSAGTHAYAAGQVGQGIDFGLVAGNTEENAEATLVGNDFITVNYTLPETGTISLWKQKADFDYNYESVWDNSGTSTSPGDNWECWIDQWGPGSLYARAPDGNDDRWADTENRAVQLELSDEYGADNYFGEWLHITVMWEKLTATTMEMNMYLNGELKDTSPEMVWQDPGSHFYLAGGHADNAAGIGMYDELAIWNRKLTDGEVEGVYSGGVLYIANPIPGDANYDGVVDDTDATTLADNWLSSDNVGWSEGDFNEDGIVDESDATMLAANWQIGTSAAASVPEPSSLIMLALGCFALLGFRSSRK